MVAMTAVSASRTGNPAATRLPNASSRIPIVSGIESSPAFFSASAKALLTWSSAVTREALDGADECASGGLHRCDDGPDLVDRVVGVADDLDIDERGVAVSGDQVRVALVEGESIVPTWVPASAERQRR